MNLLDQLEQVARTASQEAEGDWFSPDLLESDAPISSTSKARAYIAAMSPDFALALIEVCRAAKAVGYSNGFDAAYPDKLAALRESLAALEAMEGKNA